jgi:hypothetical protein
VRGPTGHDLDVSGILKPTKLGDKIVVVSLLKVNLGVRIETLPPLREKSHRLLAVFPEGLFVDQGCLDLCLEIADEFIFETLMSKLLAEDRRYSDRNVRLDSVVEQAVQHVENRDIAFSAGLNEPVGAMRPFAMRKYIRQVRVKHECE